MEKDNNMNKSLYDKSYFTFVTPPKPNTMFIISNGTRDIGKTTLYVYRPKKFNRFQRLMWKWAFGIEIKHGEDLYI